MGRIYPTPGWLHEPARSGLFLLDGDPGVGKSYLTNAFAAHLTRGTSFPGNEDPPAIGSVPFLLKEDGVGDTIRPRLDVMGANITKISILDKVLRGDDDGVLVLDSEGVDVLREGIESAAPRRPPAWQRVTTDGWTTWVHTA